MLTRLLTTQLSALGGTQRNPGERPSSRKSLWEPSYILSLHSHTDSVLTSVCLVCALSQLLSLPRWAVGVLVKLLLL